MIWRGALRFWVLHAVERLRSRTKDKGSVYLDAFDAFLRVWRSHLGLLDMDDVDQMNSNVDLYFKSLPDCWKVRPACDGEGFVLASGTAWQARS